MSRNTMTIWWGIVVISAAIILLAGLAYMHFVSNMNQVTTEKVNELAKMANTVKIEEVTISTRDFDQVKNGMNTEMEKELIGSVIMPVENLAIVTDYSGSIMDAVNMRGE